MKRREVLDHVWPQCFVGDAALASVVKELRKALGDSKRRHQYIRTEHGVGFRFVGEVHDVEGVEIPAPIRYWLVSGLREEPLKEGEHVLGRWKPSTILLPALEVSKQHASIVVDEHGARLTDLQSKNRTRLNGLLIDPGSPHRLVDGDRIGIGPFEFVFRTSDGTTATAMETEER